MTADVVLSRCFKFCPFVMRPFQNLSLIDEAPRSAMRVVAKLSEMLKKHNVNLPMTAIKQRLEE